MLLLLSSELVISFFPWVLRAHAFDVSPTDSVLWFFDHSVSRCSHIPTHRSLPPFTLQLDIQPRKHKTSKKFGSVGDANVFYWFQNRRSRSRRRQRQLQAAGLAADPGAALHARQVGGAALYEPTSSGMSPNNSSGGVRLFACSSSASSSSSSSSSLVGDDGGADDLFFSRQMAVMESCQNPFMCYPDVGPMNYQPGTITVFINGIPSEVPRGPVDLRAMFGQNVMLVHSSGELLPINEYGILLQSLQMGESYFLRYYNEGHDGISRTVILDGAAEKCNLSTHRRDSSLSSTDGYARHGRTRFRRPSRLAVSSAQLPCYGRKSVDVDETCSEPKSSIRSGSDLNASSTAKNRYCRAGEMGLSSIPKSVMPEEIKNEFGFEEMIKVKIIPGNRPKNPNFLGNLTRSLLPAEVGCRMVNSSSLFGYSHVFSFPVLNPSSLNNLAKEPPRESLEVFRPTRHTAAALSTPPDSQLAAVVSHSPITLEWSVTTAAGFDRRFVQEERERCTATGGRRRCSGLLAAEATRRSASAQSRCG
ncbi:hypothetical protein B296_00012548 [Ensete ventricosum]|uniref:Homeobox domain-containing protein n=1 Tax=Ensete ventricosum TaxID=4639 RepID=A0A427B662_ENSVE|nr:hypothetical protein B296_00012548 [Ensete ventricosum]